MNTAEDVSGTPDGYRFEGEAAAMVSELASFLGVSPVIAVGMAVHDRLMEMRPVDLQSSTDA